MKQLPLLLLAILFFAPYRANAQSDLDSLYHEGLQEMQAFKYQQALELFFECQRNDPFNPEYLSKVGYCYFQLGNLQEAQIYFKEVMKKDSVHVSSLNYLATIEEQMLDYRSALGRVEQLIGLDSTNSYYYRTAGHLSEKLGRPGKAMIYYQQAISLNPGDQAALVAYCNLLSAVGDLHQADSILESALHKQPKNLKLLYESAKANYRLRTYEQVLPRFEKALEMGDTNLVYLPLLPYSLSQMERCGEAVPWMEYILEKKEPNEQLHYFLGFCYNKLDSIEKSIEHYELAVEEGLSPNLGVYYQHMGDIMAKQDKHRTALKNYELAQKYGNTDPVIFFHMAVAFDHVYIKDKKRPLSFYKKYLANYDAKNPDFKAYAKKRVEEIDYYEKYIWKGNN
ncbi:MAG TPA: tetratricopeptide repeat protein [Bacteroidetes bacterium]|nr:tetratricopeptide repeat protein [Bacteroidota bacterium]